MRYIPMSQYSFDEIVKQCRDAINSPVTDNNCQRVDYSEVRKFFRYDNALLSAR